MGALTGRPARTIAIIVLTGLLLGAVAFLAVSRDRGGTDGPAAVLPTAPESAPLELLDGASPAQERGADPGDAADAAVVVQASQQVEVLDVRDAARQFAASIAAAGGVVSAEDTSYGDPCPPTPVDTAPAPCVRQASSTITYRADAAEVAGLLDAAAALGNEQWRNRSARDVSDAVADVDARVASARASLARLNALMSRAESLGDVIALEGQIASRQAELESLLARQQSLADQTGAATLTTTFSAAPPPSEAPGFVDGLQNGLAALGSALRAIAVALGWLLPISAVAAALLLPLLWHRRRRARRAEDGAADGAGSPAATTSRSD